MSVLVYAAPTVAEVNGPVLIPIDPESLDATRPPDLDRCSWCVDGAIQVQTGDPHDGTWDGVECWECGGTGTRGAA